MFSPTRWILVPGLCASLCGCLALKSDLAATQADLVQRLNDVEDNLAEQNQQVVRGDVDGLLAQVEAGRQAADTALATARENQQRQLEAERSLAALTARAADFVTGGRVAQLDQQLTELKSASSGVSGDQLATTLIGAALAALGGGALGKAGKSRAQGQIDELYDKTEKLGQVMAANHPDALPRLAPAPSRAA